MAPDTGGGSADVALDVAGDPTRLRILQALFRAGTGPLSFSELRAASELRDSGLFNYHLGKLVGPFVRKTDAGYELRYAGQQVVGAVAAGTYTTDLSLGPVRVDAECRRCGGPLTARYESDHGTVACADCDEVLTHYRMPPGVFTDRPAASLPDVMHDWIRLDVVRAGAGLCPVCLGATTATLDGAELVARFVCGRCGMHATTGVASVVLDHPAVVAFHYDRGVDLRRDHLWGLTWLFDREAIEVVETDPLSIAVTVSLDGDERRCLVDEDLGVSVDSHPTA